MAIQVESMNSSYASSTVTLKTECGTITAEVVASDQGQTIANHDAGDRWVALIITDYGDGEMEYDEFSEGTTFGVSHADQYVIRRTDNAGSLKWVEND